MGTDPEIGLLSTTKLQSFPVINSTCFWLTESYAKLKDVNFVTKCTCSIAETTLKNSVYLATPLVKKFKHQVMSLDTIALSQLERLEAAYPIIKSDTSELIDPVKDRYTNFRSNTKETCDSVKSCLRNSMSIDRCLNMTQAFIEQYLIYAELEKLDKNECVEDYIKYYGQYKVDEKEYNELVKRIRILTYVFYCALKANLLKEAEQALKMLTVKFAKLYMFLELMGEYKDNLKNDVNAKFYLTKEKLDLYKDYLEMMSKQFTVQDGRSLHHVSSLEDRTKIIVRRSLGNLIAAFHLVYSRVSNVIPIVHTRFTLLGQFITDLYQIYSKHDGSFNEMLVDLILREIGECTHITQCSVNLFLKNLNNSAIVSWFVPNFESFGVLDYDNEEFAIERPRYTSASKDFHVESSEEDVNVLSMEYTYSSEELSHQSSENLNPNENLSYERIENLTERQ